MVKKMYRRVQLSIDSSDEEVSVDSKKVKKRPLTRLGRDARRILTEIKQILAVDCSLPATIRGSNALKNGIARSNRRDVQNVKKIYKSIVDCFGLKLARLVHLEEREEDFHWKSNGAGEDSVQIRGGYEECIEDTPPPSAEEDSSAHQAQIPAGGTDHEMSTLSSESSGTSESDSEVEVHEMQQQEEDEVESELDVFSSFSRTCNIGNIHVDVRQQTGDGDDNSLSPAVNEDKQIVATTSTLNYIKLEAVEVERNESVVSQGPNDNIYQEIEVNEDDVEINGTEFEGELVVDDETGEACSNEETPSSTLSDVTDSSAESSDEDSLPEYTSMFLGRDESESEGMRHFEQEMLSEKEGVNDLDLNQIPQPNLILTDPKDAVPPSPQLAPQSAPQSAEASPNYREKNHACPHCDKKYVHAVAVRKHIRRMHEQEKRYSCKYCDYRAFQQYEVFYHQRDSHTGQHPHKCWSCGKGYNKRSTMLKHTKKYSDGVCPPDRSPWKTWKANQGTPSVPEAKISPIDLKIYVKGEPGRLECAICGQRSRTDSSILQHIAEDHPEVGDKRPVVQEKPTVSTTKESPTDTAISSVREVEALDVLSEGVPKERVSSIEKVEQHGQCTVSVAEPVEYVTASVEPELEVKRGSSMPISILRKVSKKSKAEGKESVNNTSDKPSTSTSKTSSKVQTKKTKKESSKRSSSKGSPAKGNKAKKQRKSHSTEKWRESLIQWTLPTFSASIPKDAKPEDPRHCRKRRSLSPDEISPKKRKGEIRIPLERSAKESRNPIGLSESRDTTVDRSNTPPVDNLSRNSQKPISEDVTTNSVQITDDEYNYREPKIIGSQESNMSFSTSDENSDADDMIQNIGTKTEDSEAQEPGGEVVHGDDHVEEPEGTANEHKDMPLSDREFEVSGAKHANNDDQRGHQQGIEMEEMVLNEEDKENSVAHRVGGTQDVDNTAKPDVMRVNAHDRIGTVRNAYPSSSLQRVGAHNRKPYKQHLGKRRRPRHTRHYPREEYADAEEHRNNFHEPAMIVEYGHRRQNGGLTQYGRVQDKPNSCYVCQKSFDTQDEMWVHKNKYGHIQKKKKNRFTERSRLYNERKNYHAEDQRPPSPSFDAGNEAVASRFNRPHNGIG